MRHQRFVSLAAILILVSWAYPLSQSFAAKASKKPKCDVPKEKEPDISRNDVYSKMPFGDGEISKYEVKYFGAKVGYGTIEVQKPIREGGRWQRVFAVEGKTGDWYKLIFVAHDKINAISRPWDFGVSKFYIEQDEGKMFGSRFQRKKWLEFDHSTCKVSERVQESGAKETTDSHDLEYGAIDAVSVIFKLRTFDFVVGKKETARVYTDGKNWSLEANPIAFEMVEVPAGKFETVKLKLQTYLGRELQQKGDVHVWIDRKTPQRPMVKVQGEIKIGSVIMMLAEFTPNKLAAFVTPTPTPKSTPTPKPPKGKDKKKKDEKGKGGSPSPSPAPKPSPKGSAKVQTPIPSPKSEPKPKTVIKSPVPSVSPAVHPKPSATPTNEPVKK